MQTKEMNGSIHKWKKKKRKPESFVRAYKKFPHDLLPEKPFQSSLTVLQL